MTPLSTFTVYVRHDRLYAAIIQAQTEEQAVIEAEDRYFSQGNLTNWGSAVESWAVAHPNAGSQT